MRSIDLACLMESVNATRRAQGHNILDNDDEPPPSEAREGARLELDVATAIDAVRPRPPAALILGPHPEAPARRREGEEGADRDLWRDAVYEYDLDAVG